MSRKDYELIARAIKEAPIMPGTRLTVAATFCPILLRDNPAFDQARFLKACGVDV